MTFERYAIYFTPQGALGTAGAAWLGWDLAMGRRVPQPPVPEIDLTAVTARPRKYGWHATIKPPFALAEGCDADALQAGFGALCADLPPVILPALRPAWMGGCLALTPSQAAPDLVALAARVVRDLDPFRAPLSREEQIRRAHPRQSADQIRNLHKWGYPHVMESFRFHLTLTGRVSAAQRDAVGAAADRLILPHIPQPVVIADLTLVGQAADGYFHEIRRAPLQG